LVCGTQTKKARVAGKPDPLEKAVEQTTEQREPLRPGQAVLASRRGAILRLLRAIAS
jgi:hypothetical protein